MKFYDFLQTFWERIIECRLVIHAGNQDILLVNALTVMVVVWAVDHVEVEEVEVPVTTVVNKAISRGIVPRRENPLCVTIAQRKVICHVIVLNLIHVVIVENVVGEVIATSVANLDTLRENALTMKIITDFEIYFISLSISSVITMQLDGPTLQDWVL